MLGESAVSWVQEYERPPRPRYDIYLDGVASGAVVTWLITMFYGMVKREGDTVGMVCLGLVILTFIAGSVWKAANLRRSE